MEKTLAQICSFCAIKSVEVFKFMHILIMYFAESSEILYLLHFVILLCATLAKHTEVVMLL